MRVPTRRWTTMLVAVVTFIPAVVGVTVVAIYSALAKHYRANTQGTQPLWAARTGQNTGNYAQVGSLGNAQPAPVHARQGSFHAQASTAHVVTSPLDDLSALPVGSLGSLLPAARWQYPAHAPPVLVRHQPPRPATPAEVHGGVNGLGDSLEQQLDAFAAVSAQTSRLAAQQEDQQQAVLKAVAANKQHQEDQFLQAVAANKQHQQDELQQAAATNKQHQQDELQQEALAANKQHQEDQFLQAVAAHKQHQQDELQQAAAANKQHQEDQFLQAVAANEQHQQDELQQAAAANKQHQEQQFLQAVVANKQHQQDELQQAAAANKQHQEDQFLQAVAANEQHQQEELQQAAAANKQHQEQQFLQWIAAAKQRQVAEFLQAVSARRSPTPPPPPPAPQNPGTGSAPVDCRWALAYLAANAAPGFSFSCPGNALGHQAMTVETCVGNSCSGHISIAVVCAASVKNEAWNSRHPNGPIDPYGHC